MFYYSTLPTKLSICVCLKLNLKVCILLLLCCCVAVKLLLLVLLSSYCHAHKQPKQATEAWHGREAKCQVILPACMSKMSRRIFAKLASLSVPLSISLSHCLTVSSQVLAGAKCLISRLLGCCCCCCSSC